MNKSILALSVFLFALSCKQEDQYLVLPQSASLYYKGAGPAPDVRRYSLVLKSTPSFLTFSAPVLFPDGHYELSAATPFHVNPGSTELFLYDSLEATVDHFSVNIPAPRASKEAVLQKVSFTGAQYSGEMSIRYIPAK
ncbi:MAG: hypothetical protein JNL13_07455 [Chitinophagaceae bacterium]|nr:hypothetical protein [Chitinophagaceae bacterium]